MDKSRRSWLRTFKRDTRGAALIEFAIAAPLLAIVLLGVIDYSMYISATMAVERAARTGADSAMANGFVEADISSAVTGAVVSGEIGGLSALTATPTPTAWCGCPDPVTGIAVATCGQTCTSGRAAGNYVTVNAQATYTHIFGWPGRNSATDTITTSTTVRIP